MTGDEIDADVGDAAENLNIGKKNRQQNQRVDPSQQNTQRAGDNYFGGGPNNELMQVWLKLSEHGQQIQDLIRRMDNLPERVRDLEKTEVVIRPRPVDGPEVIIRAAPESQNLSTRTLMIVLVSALAIVIALVACLVYWQIAHAA